MRSDWKVVDVITALRMVRAGLGIAFLPDELISDAPDIVRVDLRDPPPAIPLGLAVPIDRHVSLATRTVLKNRTTNGK